MIKTVLFDLDGTLLPMDMIQFVKSYLDLLTEKMIPHGYDPEKLGKCIWLGTERMMKNVSGLTNETVFWNTFSEFFGKEALKDIPLFEAFYKTDFQEVAKDCGFTPLAAQTVKEIHEMGLQTILATNPVFPALATESRVRWAGLEPEDFLFITTFENSRYSKPNPDYYRDIVDTLHLNPEECLMVGNDTQEDLAASALGMQVFLITDCLIDRNKVNIDHIPHGSFPDLMRYLSGQYKA